MTGDGHEEKNGIFSEMFPKKNNLNIEEQCQESNPEDLKEEHISGL